MILYEDVLEFVNNHLINITIKNKGQEFYTRCPLCNDSKKSNSKKRFHLYFNNGEPAFNCYNCGKRGSFKELVTSITNLTNDEFFLYYNNYNSNSIKSRLNKKSLKEEEKKKSLNIFNDLIKDWINENEKTNSLSLRRYQEILKEFRKERLIPNNFQLFYAYKGEYEGRIILPIFKNNDLIYFQARGNNPKYLNPFSEKEDIIFNEENLDKNKSIIVVEGLIDALSVENGTTILGSHLTKEFIKKLKILTNKDIIISLDNDKTGLEKLNKFLNEEDISNECKYFLIPFKDIKDLNELKCNKKNINNLYNFVIENSKNKFATLMKLKLGGNNDY